MNDMSNMEISKLLTKIIEDAICSEDPIEYVEEKILSQFSWNDVQDAPPCAYHLSPLPSHLSPLS